MTNLFFKIFFKLKNSKGKLLRPVYYFMYRFMLSYYGGYIHLDTQLKSPLILPHGLHGVFVSRFAQIGKNVTIFHQVTIGSIQEKGAKLAGAPIIGDNVVIGPGAKIVGGIKIGDNVKIGANCVIAENIPNNTTVVVNNIKIIRK